MAYRTLLVEKRGTVAEVRLNRPEVRNAFDALLVREMTAVARSLDGDPGVRSVLLSGEGRCFCAGVDLGWLGGSRKAPFREHFDDAMAISGMFRALYELDKPLVAAVHGAALGGGMGFPAVADIVLAADDAVFGLSEVRIGVVPACIAPFLFLRAGPHGGLKEHFISGERFSAEAAKDAGLVEHIHPASGLLEAAREKARRLTRAAPDAQAVCKRLFRELPGMPLDAAAENSARILAELKTGEEARRGIDAFFAKEKVDWDA